MNGMTLGLGINTAAAIMIFTLPTKSQRMKWNWNACKRKAKRLEDQTQLVSYTVINEKKEVSNSVPKNDLKKPKKSVIVSFHLRITAFE